MRYSVQPRFWIFGKGYGILPYAIYIGKSMSGKYSLKLLDQAKKSATDALKTTSKRVIQKATKATGDLIGNKFSDAVANYYENLKHFTTK